MVKIGNSEHRAVPGIYRRYPKHGDYSQGTRAPSFCSRPSDFAQCASSSLPALKNALALSQFPFNTDVQVT